MNTLEVLQIYVHIETISLLLSQSACFDFFFAVNERLLFGKQKNYCLLSFEKNTLFYETFFRYEKETDVNHVMKKKNTIQYALKKLLFNTIIVFNSNYFELYCTILA